MRGVSGTGNGAGMCQSLMLVSRLSSLNISRYGLNGVNEYGRKNYGFSVQLRTFRVCPYFTR